MNKIIAGLGVLLVASIVVTGLYKLGYDKGRSDELQLWKIAELEASKNQMELVSSLNKKIKDLKEEIVDYNKELDTIKASNDESIKEINNDNDGNKCIINGNLNRLHDSFTKSSN